MALSYGCREPGNQHSPATHSLENELIPTRTLPCTYEETAKYRGTCKLQSLTLGFDCGLQRDIYPLTTQSSETLSLHLDPGSIVWTTSPDFD